MTILKILSTYRFSRYYKIGFLVWDVLMLNIAIAVSFLIRYGAFIRLDIADVRAVSLLSNIFWLVLLLYKGSYRLVRTESIEKILFRSVQMLMLHVATIAVFIVLLKYDDVSRLRMLYFYVVFFLLLVSSRIIFMKMLKYVRSIGYNFRQVIIVGANSMGERMNRILSKDLHYGYKVMGFFDDDRDDAALTAPYLGSIADIEQYISINKIDEMYVALHIDKIKIINQLTNLCERYMVRIRYIPDFQQYTKASRVQISFYGNANIPVLMLRKEPLEINVNRIMKYIFDLLFSLFVIVFIFSWLFPILAIIIKLDSKGPVFFVQKRTGRDNVPFSCFKFRTMCVNDGADKIQASHNDVRVTKIGSILRRTSMDELPQFFNVLFGRMSVVGPRPHMLLHTEQYTELINNFLVRHYAKPGITGWAQVNGFRGETKELFDMQGRVEHDIWYIENWSFLLDLKIIYKTILDVFYGDKNAF